MFSFIVKGEAVPKGRPRVSGKGWIYTPKRTKEYEELVRKSYIDAGYGRLKGALAVSIRVVYKIPKGASKKDTGLMLTGKIMPTKRNGDLDNIVKSILDGLNGIAYWDDSQVVKIIALKMYATYQEEDSYTVITLDEMQQKE